MTNMSHFTEMTSSSNFFDVIMFLLLSLVTGPSFMSRNWDKRLTRNPEIGNAFVWVLRNIWRLGQVKGTKFGVDVFFEMLLNVAKWQGYSFYRFWVPKGSATVRRGSKITIPRLGLKKDLIVNLFKMDSI